MDRRSYLRTLGAVGASVAIAGCTDGLGEGGEDGDDATTSTTTAESAPNVTLSPPDTQGEPEAFAYPGYGQRVPDVTLTDPIAETEIDVRDVGTPYLMTFIFTHCADVCPLLTQALQRVQADAAENGYDDAVTFLDLTFDPERDDAARFEEYATERNVDLDAGNWHFLRAGGPEDTRAVVANDHPDGFGVPYQRSEQTSDGESTTASEGDHHEGYGFDHLSLVLLANGDGYVERAYPGPNPPVDDILDDLAGMR